jgi:hypothetical protein
MSVWLVILAFVVLVALVLYPTCSEIHGLLCEFTAAVREYRADEASVAAAELMRAATHPTTREYAVYKLAQSDVAVRPQVQQLIGDLRAKRTRFTGRADN